MQRCVSGRRSQRGFTLLEVLVAVLILAIGVVGMLGLQAASLQANRDVRQQSSAVRLATELGEMMRANKAVAIQATNNPYLVDFPATPPTANVNCFTQICTSSQLAQSDIYGWLARIQGTAAVTGVSSDVPGELPGARVVVCFDATPYDSSGLPQWACSGSGGMAVVKIGWTRLGTSRGTSTADGSNAFGLNEAARPSVVMPLIAGNT